MAVFDTSLWETKSTPLCYESHPKLKLGKGTLIGGSASRPKSKTADVYVSLQSGSTSGCSSDPWDEKQVWEIHYSIEDQHAPKNVERFQKMITYLCNQLQEGKTVHVGCIGGHGRTGLVISAIVAELEGKKNAIEWVRKHYCKKAVESWEQVKFLEKYYGVTKAEPSKSTAPSYHPTGSVGKSGGAGYLPRLVKTNEPKRKEKRDSSIVSVRTFVPMESKRCIWRGKA